MAGTKIETQDLDDVPDGEGHVDVFKDRLEGEVLGDKFRIGELLQSENHADVYSVTAIHPDEEAGTYEARVYDLQVDLKKLQQYRLRNLKRLSSRKVHEEMWEGKQVVVYSTDTRTTQEPGSSSRNDIKGDIERIKTTLESRETPEMSGNSAALPKHDPKREAARLKQRDKRRSARIKSRYKSELDNSIDIQATVNEDNAMVILLWMASRGLSELGDSQICPGEARRAFLERYTPYDSMKDTGSKGDTDVEDFMRNKQKELVSLDNLVQAMPSIIQKRRCELDTLLREPMRFKDNSMEWDEMQRRSIVTARQRLKLRSRVQELLPSLISDSDAVLRELRSMASRIQSLKNRIAARESWVQKQELLQSDNSAEGLDKSIVLSATYSNIISESDTSREELRILAASAQALMRNEAMVHLEHRYAYFTYSLEETTWGWASEGKGS